MEINVGTITIRIGKKSAAVTTASRLRIASGSETGISQLFNRYDNPRENLTYIRETVAAAMHARSEAIGKGKFRIYEMIVANGKATQRELASDHELARLLDTPNPLLDGSELLELISQWLDATGNALLLKVRNPQGKVIELWPLPATNFFIEKASDELPARYRFMPSNTTVLSEDIVHIKRPDIRTSPFYGHAVLSDVLETAKTDAALRLYQQRFFDNDAMPRAVLRWPAGTLITEEQMTEIRTAWEERYRGAANASKLAILPDGGELQPLTSGKELDFAKSRLMLRDAIREAFRIPKIVLGDTDDVNLSNAETSYRVFLRDVVDHALAKIARALTRQLAREFGDNITIEHLSVVPENEEQQLKRLELLKDALTKNEQRQLLGFPSAV
jgi:HK97 family phage portal protein